MSDGGLPVSGKSMAEVLMAHFPNVETGYSGGRYYFFCDATECAFASRIDHYGAAMSAFIGHQADMLTAAGFGDVREARAGALEDAAGMITSLPFASNAGAAFAQQHIAKQVLARAVAVRGEG